MGVDFGINIVATTHLSLKNNNQNSYQSIFLPMESPTNLASNHISSLSMLCNPLALVQYYAYRIV